MIKFSNIFKKREPQITSNKTYNFLVVAALQEELNAFTEQTSNLSRIMKLTSGAVEYQYKFSKKYHINILTYTPNRMGMAYNAASIMRVIMKHHPLYTFFIGTCAGLDSDKQKKGDVLVPQMIYNYESGKHKEDGFFHPDHQGFETDEEVRKIAEIIKNKYDRKFSVYTDENFCSGSAIVDNTDKVVEILKNSPRKVTGLDMEAYSLACINYILKEEKKRVTVIKGIMDFGQMKLESEKANSKDVAKVNSAKFTLGLIEYIYENVINVEKVLI